MFGLPIGELTLCDQPPLTPWSGQTDSSDTWSVQTNSSDSWSVQTNNSSTWTVQ